MEISENDVIKALELCSEPRTVECHKCPLYKLKIQDCCIELAGLSLDLINRLKAENQELKLRTQNLISDLTSAKEEIERLQKAIKVQDIMIEQQDYKLKNEASELQRKNSELEIELQAMRGAANSYKAETEELKCRTQNLTSENENLISALKSAKEEVGRIKSELASWQISVHNDIRRNDVVKKLENKCNMLEFAIIPELVRKAKSEIRKAVSEAYREFAERLREKGTSPELDEGKYYNDYDIDSTLTKLTERKEDEQ